MSDEPLVRVSDDAAVEAATWNRSVAALFEADTGLPLPLLQGIYRRRLRDPAEVGAALAWQARRLQHVFLADELSTAIALDELFRGRHGAFTSWGRLEAEAKATGRIEAVEALAIGLADFASSSPLYAGCAVCAVPPAPHKAFDLPSALASLVAERIGAENVSSRARFEKGKQSIKTLPFSAKPEALQGAGLRVEPIPAGPVLLIDDKYQSGTTANHIGRALRLAGATAVHGLFVLKTWRSRDNSNPPGEHPDS